MASDGWISIYAAIVSTSALLLNFKNWIDSGVKLKLSLMDNAKMFGGDSSQKMPDGQIILIVTNQGSATTTITHMVMLDHIHISAVEESSGANGICSGATVARLSIECAGRIAASTSMVRHVKRSRAYISRSP
jgi:TusA-related sulfurtransferase